MEQTEKVVVTGSFDDLRSRQTRFLEEASRLGGVHVLLWSDDLARSLEGKTPKFAQEERAYLLQAIRYVRHVTLARGHSERELLPQVDEIEPDVWVVDEMSDQPWMRAHCSSRGIPYRLLKDSDLGGFPVAGPIAPEGAGRSPRKKVVVTGCFDWLHSGHARFFEETSELGDLYVIVGHDENVSLLKGKGHPMFPQDERRYMVQSIRYVTQALISTGHGWMDAAPEIDEIKPDIYAVNEDGDKPEKIEFCREHGLEYVVLKRTPKEGLPKRESTTLRGF